MVLWFKIYLIVSILISLFIIVLIACKIPMVKNWRMTRFHNTVGNEIKLKVKRIISKISEKINNQNQLKMVRDFIVLKVFDKMKNWMVPCFYLALNLTMFKVFFDVCYLAYLKEYKIQITTLILNLNLSFFLVIFVKAKELTARNYEEYLKVFSNDNLIFFDNNYCLSCSIFKISRSKHCSNCNKCIIYYDHYCLWVNNCIGMGNYKFFLNFLFSNGLILSYGMKLVWAQVINVIIKDYNDHNDSELVIKGVLNKINFMVISFDSDKNKIIVLFFLMFCFDIVVISFTLYHIYMIRAGKSSSETDKWDFIHHLIQEKLLFQYHPKSEERKIGLIRNETNDEKNVYTKFIGYQPLNQETMYFEKINNETYLTIDGGFVLRGAENIRKLTMVTKENEVQNIYNKGWWSNLKQRLK
ncbi:DHHC family palmitoyltransferase [Ascoidea rubescens DSM 1968]|uniref:Palmitoyltransferase n=1 Tax=Ascoidea rubescens DSM 1968 TaxID=1344418 RepID=A0A1D2VD53_9ASCO|nr:zf-DHHC-domain-containing protein [Ascoidea rubescens DSM 1968]ODV59565.1 zf-DHHC-domain-containing protein [Ascoidea rubescens DSM 1968]